MSDVRKACGCTATSTGFLAGLAISATTWSLVAPESRVMALLAATGFTLSLTVAVGLFGRWRSNAHW